MPIPILSLSLFLSLYLLCIATVSTITFTIASRNNNPNPHLHDPFSPFSHPHWTSIPSNSNSDSHSLVHTHCVTLFLSHSPSFSSFLHNSLMNISTPTHDDYGKHWQLEDYRERYEEFHAEIKDYGVDKIMIYLNEKIVESEIFIGKSFSSDRQIRLLPSGDSIVYCENIKVMENVFQTKLRRHRPTAFHGKLQQITASLPSTSSSSLLSIDDHIHLYRSVENVVLPEDIKKHIAFIGGLNSPIHSHHKRKYNNLLEKKHFYSHPKAKLFSENFKSDKGNNKDNNDNFDNSNSDITPSPSTLSCSQPIQSLTNPLIKLLPPLILNYTGGDKEISIYWAVWCMDGRRNRDDYPVLPCSTIDSTTNKVIKNQNIVKFTIQLTDIWNHHILIPILPDSCHGSDGTCMSTIPVRNYEGYSLMINQHMSDGQSFSSCPSHSLLFASDFATPDFLRYLYQIPIGLRIRHGRNNSQSVIEFEGQYFDPSDVSLFLDYMGQQRTSTSSLIGPNDATEGRLVGGESSLDIQIMLAMAPEAYTVFWSVTGHERGNTEEPFLRWIREGNERKNADIPMVQSLSYGDIEELLPFWYTDRVNMEMGKMGLRGVTIVTSSGDQGIASDWSGTKDEDDYDTICHSTHPEFPASSPYVLSIGATQLSMRHREMCWSTWRGVHIGCSEAKEITCSAQQGGIITSGGGTSNRFAIPTWQSHVLEYYYQHSGCHFPPKHMWNSSGRAYPDVVAYGSKFPIIMNGAVVPTAGTSASAPLVGSMITLWNDIRISYNQSAIGYINPILYHIYHHSPESYHDIVYGNNSCLLRDQPCCKEGFAACAGYDMNGGLGSVDWGKIAKWMEEDAKGRGKKGRKEGSNTAPSTLVDMDQQTVALSSSSSSSSNLLSLKREVRVLEMVNTALILVIIMGFMWVYKEQREKVNVNQRRRGREEESERLMSGYGAL